MKTRQLSKDRQVVVGPCHDKKFCFCCVNEVTQEGLFFSLNYNYT